MRLTLMLTTLAAGAAVAQPAQPLALGVSLANESCTLQPSSAAAPLPGLPGAQELLCNGKRAGGVAYAPLRDATTMPSAPATARGTTAVAATDVAHQMRITAAFDASRIAAQLRQRLTCEAPRWLDDTSTPVLVLPCRDRSGGWPELIVAAIAGDALAIADGPAVLYPVLRAAVKAPAAPATRVQLLAQAQQLWRAPVVLASTAEVDTLKTLLRNARTAASLARHAEAEALFRQALDLRTRLFSANDPATADVIIDLALTVSNQGRTEEAAALFRRAAPIIEASPDASDRARLVTYRGYEAANRGAYADALRFAQSAVDAWRALAAPAPGGSGTDAAEGELAMARNLEALMLLRSGDPVSAYAAAGEALLILGRSAGLPRWWKSDVLMTLGEVSIAQGRLSAAETYFKSALAIRQQLFGEGVASLRARLALARAYQHEGMNSAAIIAYRTAFRIARTLPRDSAPFAAQDLVPFAAAVVDHARSLADPEARQGLYAEAFDAFRLLRPPVIDQTVSRAAARLSAADPALATRIRALQDKERALGLARLRLAHEQSLAAPERSAEREDALQGEARTLGGAIAQLRRDIEQQFPSFAQLSDPRAPTLNEVRAQLGPREGVVSFLIGRDRSFVQLVRRDGVTVGAVEGGEAALRDAVAALRRSLEVQGKSINAFDLQRAHRLYRDLFAGIEPAMAGLDQLVVVPSGPLASLPFALLVTDAPAGDDYRAANWLMKRTTLAHTPSLAALVTLRASRAAKRPDRPLLAFGNPVLGSSARPAGAALATLAGGCRTDAPADPALLRTLASLPDTATEMASVARTLAAPADSVHAGAAASEARLRAEDLGRYRVLYFATHGLLPGELKCQSEPALVLTPPSAPAASRALDGLLEASEVASLSIDADLVVLSACNTATSAASLGGDAMSGLAEAFFHAGARNMLVSHWQVPSAATAQLMSGVFTTLGPELAGGAADALRSAQLRLISDAKTAHPFFWAAFVVMGEGGASAPRLAEAQQ